MAQNKDNYKLTISFKILKNEEDNFYDMTQVYYNLDYTKLVQIEQVFLDTINKTAKFGQEAAVALGANPELFKTKS